MNDVSRDEVIEVSWELLENMHDLLREYYGTMYAIKMTKSDTLHMLCTPSFILMYSMDDMIFYLTFMVGQTGKQVATDTGLVMDILDREEFHIMEDSYFDNEKDHLVFGNEAIEVKQRYMYQAAGREKCPVCDRIIPKEYITKEGICTICEANKSMITWN
jgi:hypothetical protein